MPMTLSQLGFASDVDNSENLRRIVRRLPMHLRSRWAEIAHSIFGSGRRTKLLVDLTKCIDERSHVANSVYGLDIVKENVRVSGPSHGPAQNVAKVKSLLCLHIQKIKILYTIERCYC